MIKLMQKVNGQTVAVEATPDFCEYYDVAVVGVGTAGAVAVITAAENGLKTIGIEQLNAAGGTITMTGICGYYFGGRGGRYEQIDDSLKALASLTTERYFDCPDLRKYNLDRIIEQSGATVLYESIVIGIYIDQRKIIGLRIFGDNGQMDIACKTLIDATGDGDVCDMAGCAMDFGRATDGDTVPFSVQRSFVGDNMVRNANIDCGRIDQRNVPQYTRAILKAQSRYAKKIDNETPLRLHSLPGIREGRLLCGEEKITIEDFFEGRLTDKPIIYAYSDLDKHGDDISFEKDIFRKWYLLSNLSAINITVPIPMGCLIAKEYDNLLVAGRCLSVDRDMQTCIRMNRDMQKLGEAAAVMCLVALQDDCAFKGLCYERVASILRASGCLSEENNQGFKFDSWSDPSFVRKIEWLTDENEIIAQLSSSKPAVAIWSCRLLGQRIVPALKEGLASNNTNLAKHAALALAVMDDASGIDVLRSMVVEQDVRELTDMRRTNMFYIAMAVCAIGMLADKESIELLKKLITDKQLYLRFPEAAGYRRGYYLTLSATVRALMDIADAYPEKKQETCEFLHGWFKDYSYISMITTADRHDAQHIMAKAIYGNICIWDKNKEEKTMQI